MLHQQKSIYEKMTNEKIYIYYRYIDILQNLYIGAQLHNTTVKSVSPDGILLNYFFSSLLIR